MIWLLRHGDAEAAAADDASRRLTSKGERQARCAGQALSRLGIELTACLSSPKVRARDTAEIACAHLGLDVEVSDALRGGDFDPSELAASALADGQGGLLLVGHEPDFSRAVHASTGARIDLKKGGLAAIDEDVLARLLRPSELRVIAGE